MVQSTKTFRVFVSSTFSDLVEERNALQKNVFPKLRELCMEHGFRFQAIDLRWGVSEEAGLDQQTMKICLEEIERSQRVSPKPNFIVLLGDRYGWRPVPSEIPADEFEEIYGLVENENNRKLLDEWFRRDDNALPPVYDLQPRTGEYKNYDTWTKVENDLNTILRETVSIMDLDKKSCQKYFTSATEQEIMHGAFEIENAHEHVYCFLRKINNLCPDASTKDFIDVDKDGNLDKEATELLDKLKDKLHNFLPEKNIKEYPAKWKEEKVSTQHLDKLCRDVYNSLSTIILEEIKEFEQLNPLNVEIRAHMEFGKERSKFFIGRKDNREKIKNYLENPNLKPMLVYGDSGSGKSALMAQIIRDHFPNFYDGKDLYEGRVVVRFIGATPEASDMRSLLESLCNQIKRIQNVDDSKTPSEYNELVKHFSIILNNQYDKPLFIFLDALDQLSDSTTAHNLTWIPDKLPENVYLILSTLSKPFRDSIAHRIPKENTIQIEPLKKNEGKLILNSWLSKVRKKLTKEQEQEILGKFDKNKLPLYLKLAFEEAKQWKSYTKTPQLKPEIPGIIRQVFERLSRPENHGKILVSHSIGYLTAAKNGLTEDEILDILALDEEVFNLTKKFHNPTEEKLPIALWSRLYFDLEPYLTERSADGTSLLAFYHKQLGEIAQEDYLDENVKKSVHKKIAKYFHKQPLYFGKKEEIIYNIRKVSELPYQLTFGEMWLELEETLADLRFIQAKCAVGMINGLIEDYNRLGYGIVIDDPIITAFLHNDKYGVNCPSCLAWNEINKENIGQKYECPYCDRTCKITDFVFKSEWHFKPPNQSFEIFEIPRSKYSLEDVSDFADFVEKNMHILAENSDLTFQQAANYYDNSPVSLKAVAYLKKHNIPWIKHVNKPQTVSPLIRTIPSSNKIKHCQFSNDGEMFIAISEKDEINTWETRSGKKINKFSLYYSEEPITCYFIGPEIFYVFNNSFIRSWSVESGEEISKTKSNDISRIAISPDGTKLESINLTFGYILEIWDIKSREKIKSPRTMISCCTFAPDGKTIASASYNDSLIIWDIATGKEIQEIEVGSSIYSCDFSPDGKYIVSCSKDRASLWDVKFNKNIKNLQKESTIWTYCEFSQNNGKILLISQFTNFRPESIPTTHKKAIIWNINKDIKTNLSSNNADAHACTFSHDAEKIFLVEEEYFVILNSENYDEIERFKIPSHIKQKIPNFPNGAFSRNKLKYSYHSIEGIKVIDTKSGEIITLENYSRNNNYSISHGKIVAGGDDGIIRIHDMKSGIKIKKIRAHSSKIKSCDFSPDGNYIVSSSDDRVKLWNIKNIEEPKKILFENLDRLICEFKTSAKNSKIKQKKSLISGDFSPDGNYILISEDRIGRTDINLLKIEKIEIWDVKSGQKLKRILPIRISLYNQFLNIYGVVLLLIINLLGLILSTIKEFFIELLKPITNLLNVDTFKYTANFKDIKRMYDFNLGLMRYPSYSVATFSIPSFFLENNKVVALSHDRININYSKSSKNLTIEMIKLLLSSELTKEKDFSNIINSSSFQDVGYICTGTFRHNIKIFPAESAIMQILNDDLKSINSLAFSPNGKYIITGSDNGLKIWDVNAAINSKLIEGKNRIIDFNFSPDGEKIVTGSSEGIITVLNSEKGTKEIKIKSDSSRIIRCIFSEDGNKIISESLSKYSRKIKIWDSYNGKLIKELKSLAYNNDFKYYHGLILINKSNKSGYGSEVFDDDGNKIFSLFIKCPIEKLRLNRTNEEKKYGFYRTNESKQYGFAKEGKLFFSAWGDGSIIMGDLQAKKAITAKITDATHYYYCNFSPDGNLFFSIYDIKFSRIMKVTGWNAKNGKEIYSSEVKKFSFSPEGDKFLVINTDGNLILFNSINGEKIFSLEGDYTHGRFISNGSIVSGSKDGTIIMWNAKNGTKMFSKKGHSKSIYWLSSDHEKRIISIYEDGTIIIMDAKNGKKIAYGNAGINERKLLNQITFLPDGNRIIYDIENKIRVVDIENNDKIEYIPQRKKLNDPENKIRFFEYSPDGENIYTITDKGILSIWNSRTGEDIVTYFIENWDYNAKFNKDFTKIAIGTTNGTSILSLELE